MKKATGTPATFAAAINTASKRKFDADRILNIRPDPPDFRDRFYQPSLIQIEQRRDPPQWIANALRDQGDEGTCTGQALAAVIDMQSAMRGAKITPDTRASARMLYEMARAHDEYPDDGLEGSSARGAIKGFFHNGVCSEHLAPYDAWEPGWRLEVVHAKAARELSLGAYFRLRHVLYDYHAALCEAGAIFVTSMVHPNWETDAVAAQKGRIAYETGNTPKPDGAHAFAIIGYDADGFLILNSWGDAWGGFNKVGGVAHWNYEDWQAHVLDAWVLRLAVPSSKTFHKVGGFERRHGAGVVSSAPARSDLIGHYCHVDDGRFVSTGPYSNDQRAFEETGAYLRSIANDGADKRYDHVLLYAHGGLTDLDDAARHAALMIPALKALKIYPLFFFWRTGVLGAISDILFGQSGRASAQAGRLTDISDWVLERAAQKLIRPIWAEMKNDAARSAFTRTTHGAPKVDKLVGHAGDATMPFLDAITAITQAGQPPIKLHIVGHSAGAIFLSHLLKRWEADQRLTSQTVSTASLLAPACTTALYKSAFEPILTTPGTDIAIYALNEHRELDDAAGPYRKSILHLVSRALEEKRETAILGLEQHARAAAKTGRVKTYIAGPDPETQSADHGGFDNDPATLNHVLSRILSRKVDELSGGFSPAHFGLVPPRHGS